MPSEPIQCFRGRGLVLLLASLVSTASGFTADAQSTASNQRAVRLTNLVAMDSAGDPVPDLAVSVVAVFDNGSPQQIVSLRLNQSDTPGLSSFCST